MLQVGDFVVVVVLCTVVAVDVVVESGNVVAVVDVVVKSGNVVAVVDVVVKSGVVVAVVDVVVLVLVLVLVVLVLVLVLVVLVLVLVLVVLVVVVPPRIQLPVLPTEHRYTDISATMVADMPQPLPFILVISASQVAASLDGQSLAPPAKVTPFTTTPSWQTVQ